jgi:hypothetical protein
VIKTLDTDIKPVIDINVFATLEDSNHLDIQCRCGNTIRIPDIYLTEYGMKRLRELEERYEQLEKGLSKALIEIYGEDPRRILLTRKLNKLKEDYFKTRLRVIKDQD